MQNKKDEAEYSGEDRGVCECAASLIYEFFELVQAFVGGRPYGDVFIKVKEAALTHARAVKLIFQRLVKLQLRRMEEYLLILLKGFLVLGPVEIKGEFRGVQFVFFEAFLKGPEPLGCIFSEIHFNQFFWSYVLFKVPFVLPKQ